MRRRLLRTSVIFSIVLAATAGMASAAVEPPPAPAASAPASATTAPAPKAPADLVVTAKPPTPHELAAIMEQFVRSHGAPARFGRFAFWSDAVCPWTMGLSPILDEAVSQRVTAVGAQVGAPVAKTGCRPNVLVIFTDQPQMLLDQIVARQPRLLGFHYAAQVRRLATFDRLIKAWYATASRNGPVEYLDDEFGAVPSGRAGTRLAAPLTNVFKAVMVVADARRVSGREVGPIADYVALLALSQPRSLDGCDAAPSIIDLMSPVCGAHAQVTALTSADLAYLRGLYTPGSDSTLPTIQANAIAVRMARKAAKHP